MDAIDAWAMATDDYSQWENIAVAALFFGGLLWLLVGLPGIPRHWLNDEWRRASKQNPRRFPFGDTV